MQGPIPLNGTSIEPLNEKLARYDSFPVQMRRCLPSYDSMDIRYEHNHYMHFYGGPIKLKEIRLRLDGENIIGLLSIFKGSTKPGAR